MRKTMKLASRGKRLGAGLIDISVPLVSYFILLTVYGISLASYGNRYGYGSGYGYGYGYDYGYNMPQSSGSGAGMLVLSFLLIAYLIAELVLYARGQSIGKAILGLQVVSSKDGKPFRFWKMMLRECIVKNASGSAFLLGYIWILIDEKNRGWHDKILDSYVVDLKETANMYQRSEASYRAVQPEPEVHVDTETEKEAEHIPASEEPVQKSPDTETVERIEAPDKIEVLEAPEQPIALSAQEDPENIDAVVSEEPDQAAAEEDNSIAADTGIEIENNEDNAEIK